MGRDVDGRAQGLPGGQVEPAAGSNADAFVGRAVELADLLAAVDAVTQGTGSSILLAGEPGIGKTRLAEEVARAASARGCAVAWGRAWEAGGAPPFWPWTRALRTLLDQAPDGVADDLPSAAGGRLDALLGDAAGALTPVSETMDERFALFEAVAATLRAVASRQPVVVVLDDLHAADEPTLRLFQFVAREIGSAAILLLGTHRDVDAPALERTAPLLAQIAREAQHVTLTGLSEEEIAQLSATQLDAPLKAGFVRDLSIACGGNPFFARELLRLQRTTRQTGLDSGLIVPRTVRDTVRQRLTVLPATAAEALRVAAVLGREFDVVTIGRVLDLPVEEIEERLEPAAAAGLVELTATAAWFAHGLIREVLYADTKTTVRARLHARVLEVFERLQVADQQRHLSELAHHALAAASAGADRAIDYATAAAELAMQQLAFEEAVRQYELALRAADLVDADRSARLPLLLGLATAYGATGDFTAARAAAMDAAAAARAAGSAQGLAQAALVYPSTSQIVFTADRRLVALIEEALDVTAASESAVRARLLSRLAWEEYYIGGTADEIATEALEQGRASGDLEALFAALLIQGMHHLGQADGNVEGDGAPAGALPGWIVEAFAVAEQLGDPRFEVQVLPRAIYYGLEHGRMDEVNRLVDRHAALVHELQLPLEIYWSKVMRAMQATYTGLFDEAPRLVDDALTFGFRFAGEQCLAVYGAQKFLARRERYSREELEELKQLPDDFRQRIAVRAGIMCAEAAVGDPSAARRELRQLTADDFALLPKDRSRFTALAMITETAVSLDDVDVAERVLPLLEVFAGLMMPANVFAVFGTFDRARGLALSVLGRLEEAEVALRSGLALAESTGGRPLAGHTRRELAAVVRRRGELDEARALLDEALGTARELGMDWLRDLVEADIATLGGPSATKLPAAVASAADPAVTLKREAEYWSVTAPPDQLRFRDTKGLRYLATLIANPGVEIHAMELVSEVGPSRAVARPEELPGAGGGGVGPALDATAKAQYRRRLDDLRAEIDEADAFNDPERASRAREEFDFLVSELSRAVGLGGRDRPQSSPGEQARINVTKAIRAAVKRISEQDPQLATQLTACLRTGTFCSYRPVVGTATWSVEQ